MIHELAYDAGTLAGRAAEKPRPPPSEDDLRDLHNLDWLIHDIIKRTDQMDRYSGTRRKEARAAGIGLFLSVGVLLEILCLA